MRMTAEDRETALEALSAVPFLARADVRDARLTRLAGLTNRVYRVDVGGYALCVRIPGPGTAAIIDRHREEANARAAAAAGIAPDVVYFGTDGVMVTHFVEGTALIRPRLKESAPARARTAQALRRLHDNAPPFEGTFEPFAVMDDYVALLAERARPLAEKHRLLLAEAGPVREALTARPVTLKPCHCDTSGGNLLDTGTRVWLVDWEYSAENDPMWDLSYLSVQAGLGNREDLDVLAAYFNRPPKEVEQARFAVVKAPVELQAALWALVQDSAGNRSGDFAGYADATFTQCAERMKSEAFKGQMGILSNA